MTRNGSSRPPIDCAQESFPGNGQAATPSALANQFGEFGRQMLSTLSHTIEGDIIPRLMLAFDSRRTGQAPAVVGDQLTGAVEEFVQLVLNHDATVATNYVSTLRSDGVPLAALYLDLIAPSARRLGQMWEEDEVSFTDVTIGVCRMHQVLLEFSRCFDAPLEASHPGQNALILPVPGEQHTFGLFMVMEFMRRANWNCFSGQPAGKREFMKLVDTQDFDMIGISVGASNHIEDAADLIADIRGASRNRDAIIMAGGQVFLDDPSLAARIGADATATDGHEAVREATRLARQSRGTPAT